ncbi:MAG TPA: hypothetical protein VH186_11155 [Chloroflexia bacterium]|nr:hypothetical protein [Chloroflexia bacterium]
MLRRTRHSYLVALSFVFLLLCTLTFSSFSPAPAAAEECQTFKETGFTVCGRFLDYWKTNGGLAQQGFPISAVFEEKNAPPPAGDGQTHRVQYFQRARFEEHTENQAPYDVLLGLLGSEQYQAKYVTSGQQPASAGDLSGDCQLFSETGFKVCGRFLEYWKANGGLAQQGYPISNLFEEQNAPPPAGDGKTHRVQYFQRARFEEHTENQAPYDVLLGLLGTEQYTKKYGSGTTPGGDQGGLPAIGCLRQITPTGHVLIQTCLDNASPAQNSNVTVYGRLVVDGKPASGQSFNTIWHFKSGDVTCDSTTDAQGVASCTENIGAAPSDFSVKVEIHFNYRGQVYTNYALFNPS